MNQSSGKTRSNKVVLSGCLLFMMGIASIASVSYVAAFEAGGATSSATKVAPWQRIPARYNDASGVNAIASSTGLSPSVLPALTLTVNSLGDTADATLDGNCDTDTGSPGNQCTLRAAIQETNNIPSDDTINFSLAPNSTITLLSALDAINGNLTINGPGANLLTVQRSTAAATRFRIFTINSSRTVSISGHTITNGMTADGIDGGGFGGSGAQGVNGGGIHNSGTLSLTDVVVTGNRTGNGGDATTGELSGFGGFGGGIYSIGALTMTNVTVSNNTAGKGGTGPFGGGGGRGGGIYFAGTGLTMTDCAVTGNAAGNGSDGTNGASSGSGGDGGGINAETGLLQLTNTTVDGNRAGDGAPSVASGGGHGGGILTFPAVSATMADCTVSNNNSGQGGSGFSPQGGLGGGIINHGSLTMSGCTVIGNFTKGPSVSGGSLGGGIFNNNILIMRNSTVSGNRTHLDIGRGGGIYNNVVGTVSLTNCTITGNSAISCCGFESGQGIHNGGTANVGNSIIAGNGNGNVPDVTGDFNSQGHNLIGKAKFGPNHGGNGEGDQTGFVNGNNQDQVGTQASPLDARLGPLANNGGPTQTHAPLSNSPAIDKGNNSLATAAGLITDQRGAGFPRFVDGNGDSTSSVDIGAFEANPSQQLTVNTLGDAADVTLDGNCDTDTASPGNQCTLRAAIQETNNIPSDDTINFSLAPNSTITLLSALDAINGNLTITGPGANLLTVQRSAVGGTPNFSIFTINSFKIVNIFGLTISGGNSNLGGGISNSGSLTLNDTTVSGNTGGGIYSAISNGAATVAINNSTVSGNTANAGITNITNGTGSATMTISNSTISGNSNIPLGGGGGILNLAFGGTATIDVNNSTISGNNASGGGGIYNLSAGINNSRSSAIVTIDNSTISGNSSSDRGGGIYNHSGTNTSLAKVTVNNGTITNNGASNGSGGGINNFVFSGMATVMLRNTLVAGNFINGTSTADNISGALDSSSSFNLIGTGGSGGLVSGSNSNQVGVSNPLLGPLANNGGPTQTHALLAGSPALDAGNNAFVTDPPFTGPTFNDQRGAGFLRIRDAADADTTATVDIGAFEADPSVEDISNKSTNEDISLPTFAFNVGDAATPFTNITATSDNQALVPNGNIILGPDTPSTRKLSITPAANQSGAATITVTVTKAISGTTVSMSDTFVLTVNTVNDPPDASDDPLTSVAEDSGVRTIPIASLLSNDSAGPSDESGQMLSFSLVVASAIGGMVSSDGTNVYFTPTANYNGPASFQYTLTDNGSTNGFADSRSDTATASFTITEVNDAPMAVNDTLSNVAENSGQRTIPFATLTANDSKGPANESSQALIVKTVGNAVGGTVSISGGNVLFTPTANYNGPASFDYTVEDNGTTNGVADPKTSGPATVSFNISDVNAAPTAVNDPLGNMTEDAPQRSIPFSVLTGNDSPGPANESGQTLIVKTVSNPVGITVSIVGNTVRFTPLPDYNGPASFRYTVEDNGTTNGVLDPKTSAPALAHFNITEVNDAPAAVNDTLTSAAEDSGQRTIPFSTLTVNDSKGPANESSQTLTVKTVGNAVGGTVSIVGGNVVFTSTANYFGPASFDYTVEDNGTTNGAADPKTSGPATVTFNLTAAADTPSVTNATTNANTQTTSGLVISRNPADGAEVTHFKINGITGGLLFQNDGVTPINNGDFITFAEGNAGLKFTPGTTNGSFTVQASTNATDAGLGGGTATATITINPLGGIIRFSSANYSVPEGAGFKTITVERNGDTSRSVTVDYASSDHSDVANLVPCTAVGTGLASSRCDFTAALGTLRFAAGETTKTFIVLISQDNYVEGPETLSLTLSNLTGGAVVGVPSIAVLQITDDIPESSANPIDTSSEFVRAQYHDILGREPDAAGLAFWTDNIEKCNDSARRPSGQTVAQCIDKQRESTAIAFFMSPEFQMTGGFVYHLYKGSLTGTPNYDGGSPNSSPGRFPTFLEFMRDMGQVSEGIVVNGQISGAVVEANRNALATAFVQRPEFVAKYGGLNNTLYVEELFNTTGIAATAAQKQALVDGLTNATETRASVLRKVVDGTVVISESNVQFTTPYGQAFINQENRRLFVYLEYVGYLRRNPDAAGFVFWLGKLNSFNGDPFQAEMVRSFILSPEYRSRFGQP